MITKLSLFLILVVSLFAPRSAMSQIRYSGKVLDVIDGKTVLLELPSGKMRVILQYIDVPEPDQPLNKIVINHLADLTRAGSRPNFTLLELRPTM